MSNSVIWIEAAFVSELKIDQSVAHNGVCLTVDELDADAFRVTAVAETLNRTNLGTWKAGDVVNLERSLRLGDRIDGHLVQGHVDCTARLSQIKNMNGSWWFEFELDEPHFGLLVKKGSVCVDGVSLTVAHCHAKGFAVAVIPYTFSHTLFGQLAVGHRANIEFDILGKYAQAQLRQRI